MKKNNSKKDQLDSILKYIDDYWEKITCYHPKDKQSHLGVPFKYVCPNDQIFRNDMFYWDTYFTILGLLKISKVKLAQGMVDNFIHLYNRFGIIPMRNRYYDLGTSQIPFLTSMIFEVYNITNDKKWLRNSIKIAEKELRGYWMNEKLTEKHLVYKGLSRYCDHFITHLGAEHESGWDMTSRFGDRCLDILPIDLNSCLYKYEMDISECYRILKKPDKAKEFRDNANKRKRLINKLMWSTDKSFFFDYNKNKKKQIDFYSVAGFYPLWAKLANKKQSQLIRDKLLPEFEYKGGIVNTLNFNLSQDFKQHDFPNGWPHQQYIVIKGLLNYGYEEDARRIASKWIKMSSDVFSKTKKLWEKYDVVNESIGKYNPDRYPTQEGFGWTNSVFLWLASEFYNANTKTQSKKV